MMSAQSGGLCTGHSEYCQDPMLNKHGSSGDFQRDIQARSGLGADKRGDSDTLQCAHAPAIRASRP